MLFRHECLFFVVCEFYYYLFNEHYLFFYVVITCDCSLMLMFHGKITYELSCFCQFEQFNRCENFLPTIENINHEYSDFVFKSYRFWYRWCPYRFNEYNLANERAFVVLYPEYHHFKINATVHNSSCHIRYVQRFYPSLNVWHDLLLVK